MTARVHPGSVIHVWDHFVITLRGDDGRETGFLSWYAIAWSAELGAGNVALFEAPGEAIAMTLCDDEGLGRRMQSRLRAMGYERPSIRASPVLAAFTRRPFNAGAFGVRILAPGHEIDAAWTGVATPFWVDGEGGGFHAAEDIWAAFVEAPDGVLSLDGRRVPGGTFSDDLWIRTIGRPLSSAHAALSEVRVIPVP